MLPDMVPIVWELPRSDIRIYPVYDLHIGAAECMVDEWEAFLAQVAKEDDARLIIGGDMLNNGIKSSATNVYEETMRPREQKQKLTEYLKTVADKILCGVCGNHEYRSCKETDDDPLYDVFCKLDIEDKYRQNGAFVKLRFGDKAADGLKNPTYMLAALHGAGGGMYIGSSANRGERFGAVIDGLDCLITGHTHKPLTFPVAKLVFDSRNERVTQKDFRVIAATSWMRYGGYGMRRMMLPTAHKVSVLTLCGTAKRMTVTM